MAVPPLAVLLLAMLLLAGCNTARMQQPALVTEAEEPVATITPTQSLTATLPVVSHPTVTPSETFIPTETALPIPTETPTSVPSLTPAPLAWQDMPIIPTVSGKMILIYQRGLEKGNNPHAFSKVGDCQNVESMFLAIFDKPPAFFNLGEYTALQATIDWFAGSFERHSQAVKGGFNGAALMSTFRADPKACEKGETPLACEYRLQRPVIAIISLETWWSKKPAEVYEKYLRMVIEYTLEQGIVPIVATKADNLEGDHSINATVGKLAQEYEIPLWNFWKAVQPLPNGGLSEDGFHLTFADNDFSDKENLQSGWPVRNLTALQALDAVWRGLMGAEIP